MHVTNDFLLQDHDRAMNGKPVATRIEPGEDPCRDLILVSDSADGLVLVSASAEATEKLGATVAGLLTAGSVVSLEGDLGAGKTLFTRGLAHGLHCRGAVASPTFTILMEHPAGETGLALYHFDVYRLANSDEFVELGFDEYLDGGGVSVIEWGDLIRDILPDRTIRLIFSTIDDAREKRQIAFCWPDDQGRLAELARQAVRMAGHSAGTDKSGGDHPC